MCLYRHKKPGSFSIPLQRFECLGWTILQNNKMWTQNTDLLHLEHVDVNDVKDYLLIIFIIIPSPLFVIGAALQ